MMQYKASSISRFYIRFALSLRDKRGKARSFCNFNARYSLHARKSFRKFPAKFIEARSFARRPLRNSKYRSVRIVGPQRHGD